MWFRHPAWIPVAWILSGINVAAVWFAAGPGEAWHATSHAALAVLFGLGAQYLATRRRPRGDADVAGRLLEIEPRLAELEKLHDVQGRLAELEERLDFTERALVDVRSRAQRPPKE